MILISRLKAYGFKWYRWYSRIRYIQPKKVKVIPERYRKRVVISSDATGKYTINGIILKEYDDNKLMN